MKIMRVASLLVFCFSSAAMATSRAVPPKVVNHVVVEDETAWFLAQVYYGSGLEFPRLLTSNQLSRPSELKQGMKIRIKNPVYFKQQSQFASRYIRLWEQRQKALGLKAGSALPHAQVVIPTDEIRNRDQTPKLPFAEIPHSAASSAGLKKKESLRRLPTADQGE